MWERIYGPSPWLLPPCSFWNPFPVSGHSSFFPFSSPWQPSIYSLSLWICLFWPCHINGTYPGGGDPKPPLEFIYKKSCIYSYMFKLQSPSKYCPFDVVHLSRHLFHCSKQFLNSSILMLFSASAILFHLSHISKMFPFEYLFHLGKQNKVAWGWDGVNKEGGAQGSCCFGQKLLITQHSVGRCAHKSPIMKWANFTEAKHSLSQQCQLVHWHRWVPRTLT